MVVLEPVAAVVLVGIKEAIEVLVQLEQVWVERGLWDEQKIIP